MNKILIVFISLFLILLSCEKKENDDTFSQKECLAQHFYYTNDEKYYIDSLLLNDYLLIGFKRNCTIENINELLDSTNIFNINNLSILTDTNKILIIGRFKNAKTCIEINTIIDDLQRNEIVNFAAHTYKGELCIGFDCTEIMSYTNEITVKLNDSLKFDNLQTLCLSTDTRILKKSERGRYLIEVDKNSQGNALKMANLFYESGLFEYSHPNFHYFNIK